MRVILVARPVLSSASSTMPFSRGLPEAGSNFVGYSNKEVDKLIDTARQELSAAKRKPMWQKISKLIADDAPYTFFFNPKYDLMLINKKIGYEKPTYQYDLAYPFFYMAPQ